MTAIARFCEASPSPVSLVSIYRHPPPLPGRWTAEKIVFWDVDWGEGRHPPAGGNSYKKKDLLWKVFPAVLELLLDTRKSGILHLLK